MREQHGYEALRALMHLAHSKGAMVGCLTNVGNPMLYEVGPIISDKIKWMKREKLGPFAMFWTVSGIGKAAFAHKQTLLIDDSATNCSAFIKAGGNAVVYQDSNWEAIVQDIENNYEFIG